MALGVGWNSTKVRTPSSWDKLLKYNEQQGMKKLMRWSWVSNGKIGEIHPPKLLVPSSKDIYKVTKTLKFKCLFGVKL